MDIRQALRDHYRAGLGMLEDGIRKCPDDLWTSPSAQVDDGDRKIIRSFWRIAFHAAYFTHLYLGQNEGAFQPWPERRQNYYEGMWHAPWDIEPYEFPQDADPITRLELLAYLKYIDTLIDPTVDGLDLDSPESGFRWYQMSKLSHQLLNLRHLQGHVGQLSELLITRDLDIEWL